MNCDHLDDFVRERLIPDAESARKKVETLEKTLQNYRNLRLWAKSGGLVNGRVNISLGSDVSVDGIAGILSVDIGCGFYLQMDAVEAGNFCDKRIPLLETELDEAINALGLVNGTIATFSVGIQHIRDPEALLQSVQD